MTRRVAILGAGGHARVVEDILRLQAEAGADIEFAGFIGRVGDNFDGAFLGTDENLERLYAESHLTHVVLGIGSVRGGPSNRTELATHVAQLEIPWHTAQHPSAVVASSVEIGDGSVIMAGAVLNPCVRVGQHAIINTRSCVDHDCQVGDHVHIAPGATLSGNVTIGARSLIGVGASCKQGINIGSDSTVGAGAVVICDFPAKSRVLGVPGKASDQKSN